MACMDAVFGTNSMSAVRALVTSTSYGRSHNGSRSSYVFMIYNEADERQSNQAASGLTEFACHSVPREVSAGVWCPSCSLTWRRGGIRSQPGQHTWKMVSKAEMSCMASASCRQSSPDLTMTGRSAHPGRRPYGLRCRTRSDRC
jgi:hypothetical protein